MAVGIEEESHHHGGVEGCPSHAVFPVESIEGGEIELLHHIEDEEGQGVLFYPFSDG
ncbi:MAG: hypothetical protein NTV33_09555 [Coprothermobacterota bacterium]|nr:hypothetical protein [Coprothermobacterota bacterium]